jgi:hypothetical protein
MGFAQQLNLEDIKVFPSSLFKGKIAPKGTIFYIAKVKVGNMVYERCSVPLIRANANKQQEDKFAWDYKINFFNELKKKLNPHN